MYAWFHFIFLSMWLVQSGFGSPGAVIGTNFPEFSAAAMVTSSAEADDGGVFLAGDFTSVDGVAHAGLAKLDAAGKLDLAFVPGELAIEAGVREVFALAGGRVLVTTGNAGWVVLEADGSVNSNVLPGFSGRMLRRQFRQDGRVFMITGEPRRLVAFTDDLSSVDAGFEAATGPQPPARAVPAGNGYIWVLGRDGPEDAFPIIFHPNAATVQSIWRLLPDGTLDPNFPARLLDGGSQYELRARADGGYALIEENLWRYQMWPQATRRGLRIRNFSPSGDLVSEIPFAIRFGDSLALAIPDLDESWIVPNENSSYLIRKSAGNSEPIAGFRVPLAGADIIPTLAAIETRALARMANGDLLVGGNRRLTRAGTVRDGWHVARFTRSPNFRGLKHLRDGGILVSGDFDRVAGIASPGLATLRPDGSLVAHFVTELDFRFLSQIEEMPDGTLIALFSKPVRDDGGHISRLVRVSADGVLLGHWPQPPAAGSASISFGEIHGFTLLADGSTVVSSTTGSDVPTQRIWRIEPDGTHQPGVGLGDFSLMILNGNGLLGLADGTYFRGNKRFDRDGTELNQVPALAGARPTVATADGGVIFVSSASPWLYRWHPQAGLDASFGDAILDLPGSLVVSDVVEQGNGKLLVRVDQFEGLSLLAGPVAPNSRLIRLHATGQLDPTFRAPTGGISAVLDLGDGTALIAGNVSELDGMRHGGLARLEAGQAIGYEAWIAAAAARTGLDAAALEPEADPDADGVANFLEYAASSDPFASDPWRGQARVPGGIATWEIPSNPDAPEIVRRISVSSDLENWRLVTGSEVRIHPSRGGLRWSILGSPGYRFTRVEVSR